MKNPQLIQLTYLTDFWYHKHVELGSRRTDTDTNRSDLDVYDTCKAAPWAQVEVVA